MIGSVSYFVPDWLVISGLVLWVAPFFAKPLFDRLFERRAKLVSYLLHPSAVQVHPPDGSPVLVRLHTVVVKNTGKKPAANVRLGHNPLREVNKLPDFSVFPNIQYKVDDLPGRGKEIVFPVLVPGEQVTIQYLYFAPILWNEINTHTKSDDGPAKILTVLPTPQLSRPMQYAYNVVLFIGVVAILYVLLLLITLAAHVHNQTPHA